MANFDQRTVVLEVTFAKRQPAQPILNRLMEAGLHSATVLRGRVTSSDAWFQLELQGTPSAIDTAVSGHEGDALCFPRFTPMLA